MAGLFFSTLIVVLLMTSIQCWFGYEGRTHEVSASLGALMIGYDPGQPTSMGSREWFWHRPGMWSMSGGPGALCPLLKIGSPVGFWVWLPLWIPLLAIGIPSTIMWRRSRLGPTRVAWRIYFRFFVAHASGVWLLTCVFLIMMAKFGVGHWSMFVLIGVLFALTPIAAFIWSDIHVHRHSGDSRCDHCQTCGYNLTGNVSGVCPECGTEIEHS